MKKNVIILFAIVFSLLAVGTGCGKTYNDNSAGSNEDNSSFTERNNQMYVSAVVMHGVKIVTTKVASKINTTTIETEDYGTALGIYGKSGYRFQFVNCSVNPSYLTMKLGVKFMIDNRDNESHQIGIGTKIYNLGAYDFAIVSIQKIGDFIITCDGGGAAHVLIQS